MNEASHQFLPFNGMNDFYPPPPQHNQHLQHHQYHQHQPIQPQVFYNQYNHPPQFNHQFIPANYHQVQLHPDTNLVPPDPFTTIQTLETNVKPKEKILEEIVRECEEIERRSNSSGSPESHWSSSDERDTPSEKSYRPYKTPEKKERKKAQNRLAATRYREKKRREKEEAMTCIEGLTVVNLKLKDQVAELEREIRYFRKFMTEMGMRKLNFKP
ncbi:unnamed protein product [Caenorhabditis brenneri]